MTTTNEDAGLSAWAPERIWLQNSMGDDGSHTWCSHPVGDNVTEAEYVRADLAPSANVQDKREANHTCPTCKGLREVDDGEITGSGGVDYENGPIKCLKDCPDCAASTSANVAQGATVQSTLQYHPDERVSMKASEYEALVVPTAQGADAFEWLETELSAISCQYHGNPGYDHDAYWMKDRALKLIDDARKIFSAPPAQTALTDDARDAAQPDAPAAASQGATLTVEQIVDYWLNTPRGVGTHEYHGVLVYTRAILAATSIAANAGTTSEYPASHWDQHVRDQNAAQSHQATEGAKEDKPGYIRRLREQVKFPKDHTAPHGFLLVRKYDLKKLIRDYEALATAKPVKAAAAQGQTEDARDEIRRETLEEACAAIKAEADKQSDDDYMLNSDDCIRAIRALTAVQSSSGDAK